MSEYIAVFFGGVSGENEISIITGTMACNVLKKRGRPVLPVYITQSGEFMAGDQLSDIAAFSGGKVPSAPRAAFTKGGVMLLGRRGKVKKFLPVGCAVNCCHGGWGEGGGISGLCLSMSLPLASAGVFESSLFLDKRLTKIVLRGLGVDVLEGVYLRDIGGATQIKTFPVMVKPVSLGSSIGVVRAGNEEELRSALEAAFMLDDGVLVERYVSPRREINCAACLVGGEIVTSPPEEVFGGEILSYDDKYSGGGRRQFPARLSENIAERIRSVTRRVYGALGMRGIIRIDYILEGDKVWLSEVNTVPGSLSHYLLSENFSSFGALLEELIAQAEREFAEKNSKMLVNTGIINNFASNACKLKG